jgi:hypothetical protein
MFTKKQSTLFRWITPKEDLLIVDHRDKEMPKGSTPSPIYTMNIFFINPISDHYIQKLQEFGIFDCTCFNPNKTRGMEFYAKSLNFYDKRLIKLIKEIDDDQRQDVNNYFSNPPQHNKWEIKKVDVDNILVSKSTIYFDNSIKFISK